MIIYLLEFANIIIPIVVALRASVNKSGVEINHIGTFTLGYLFYWIVPIIAGSISTSGIEMFKIPVWTQLFATIPIQKIIEYLIIVLCCYLSFVSGSALGRLGARVTGQPRPAAASVWPGYVKQFFDKRFLNVPLCLVGMVSLYFGFLIRSQFFHGYTNNVAEQGILPGQFEATAVFILVFALVYSMKLHEEQPTLSFSGIMRNRFFLVYGTLAILILSTGSRLYVLSAMVMLSVFRSVYFGRVATKTAALAISSAGVLCGLLGVVRLSASPDFTSVLTNVFGESLLSSLASMHFLTTNAWEAFRMPIFLLSDYVNLVPTILLPNKLDLMADPENYGYTVYNPGGALGSFFSFMVNFGVFGSIIAFFVIGGSISYLRYRDANLLYRVSYVLLCGWLVFTFFRDPFSVSLVKTMTEFSFLVPIGTVILAQLASVALRQARKSALAAVPPSVTG